MSEVSKDLKKLSKTWSKTDAKKGGGSNVKDGDYVVKITSMTVGKSKAGRLQVAEKFKIVEPKKNKGTEFMAFHGLESENNIAYFKGHCEVLGIELPDDMEELPDVLEAWVEENEGDAFDVKVKTKDGYQNTSVLGVAGESSSDDEDGEEDGEEDADNDDDDNDGDDDEDGEEDGEEEEEDGEEDEEEEEEEDKKDKKKKAAKKGKDKKKDKKKKKK